jgi:hypothetical protein
MRCAGHAEAKWAMPADVIDAIDTIRIGLEPTSGIEQFAWLFTRHPALPEGRNTGYQDYQNDLLMRRTEAVALSYARGGLDAILQLTDVTELPGQVGNVAADVVPLQVREDELLRTYLAVPEDARAAFALGFAHSRARSGGIAWVERKLTDLTPTLSTSQRVQLLRLLPPELATWTLTDREGSEVDTGYWDIVDLYALPDVDPTIPVRKLLGRGRVFAAIQFLAHLGQPNDHAALVLEAFEALTGDVRDEVYSSFSYDAGVLLNVVEAAGIDDARVAQLEWFLLPVVDEHERHPAALHRALAKTPSFFVEVVALVFRGDQDEDVEDSGITEEGRERANRAYTLLQSWRRVPGQRDDGIIDSEELIAWVRAARQSLIEFHRLGIGDELIGQMLSGSPPDSDGAWPTATVRNVVEEVESDDLDRGISIGAYNRRGVIMRSGGEGGALERSIAERYEGYAAIVADRWSRTAALLRRIANMYRSEAAGEDHRLALRDDLGE